MLLLQTLFLLSTDAIAQTPLVNGGAVFGTISAPGEIGEFIFEAKAGEAVQIRVAETSGDGFYPRAWLYNPDGSLNREDRDSTTAAFDCHSTSSYCQLNQTGTYSLVVADYYDDDVGSYDVHFARLPGANENGTLANQRAIAGDITVGDIDTFVFEAKAGEAVQIRVAETSGDGFYPRAWLYNPDGSLNREDRDSTTAAFDCHSTSSYCQLNQTGTYSLVVADYYDDDVGGYDVHFARLPGANENGTLANQRAIAGDITVGDIDTFVFEAKAGEAVQIRVAETSGDGFYPRAWLYNPDGSLNREDRDSTTAAFDCHSTSSYCQLNQTGTYSLVVADYYDDDVGGYQVSFVGPPQATKSLSTYPLDSFANLATITQDYSCRGKGHLVTGSIDDECFSANNHHVGLDLIPTPSSIGDGVYAAGAGEVESAVTDCIEGDRKCNDGYGNTLIIRHDKGLYTLYAHLKPKATASVFVTSGRVEAGQQIADMGSTGAVTGAHLHFEVKNHGGLKDRDNTDTNRGYVPTHPSNQYGYRDPWAYFAATALVPTPLTITNGTGLYALRGPGVDYSALTEVTFGQRYVAFAKYAEGGDVYYRIHLPCRKNSCAAWVKGTVGGVAYSLLTPRSTQVLVRDTGADGLNVREAPRRAVLDKIWDGQRFVWFGEPDRVANSGCNSSWYQVHLPLSSGATSGWVCGDYAKPVGGEGGTSGKGNVRLQGASATTRGTLVITRKRVFTCNDSFGVNVAYSKTGKKFSTVDDERNRYRGNYTQSGSEDRKITMKLDARSKKRAQKDIAAKVKDCIGARRVTVKIRSANIKGQINRPRNAVSIQGRFKFKVKTDGDSGGATFTYKTSGPITLAR